MKNKSVYFTVVGLFILSLGFWAFHVFWEKFETPSNLINGKQFISDITYANASRPLFSQGVTLSDVKIPTFPTIENIGRLQIERISENAYEIKATHVQINPAQLVLETEPSKAAVLKNLKDYIPYQDMVRRPLFSLLLAHPATIRGNAVFYIENDPQTKQGLLKGHVHLNGLFSISFIATADKVPNDFIARIGKFFTNKEISALDSVSFTSVQYTLTDKGFNNRYETYLKTLPSAFIQDCQRRYPALHTLSQTAEHNSRKTIQELRAYFTGK